MNIRRLKSVTLLALAVALSLVMGSVLGAEKAKPLLSKKELKQLIARAKTAEDHQKLATYYQQQAQWLESQQKKYEAMAIEYEKSPIGYPTKHPTRAASYRNLAAAYAQRAKKAYAFARAHEEQAKAAVEWSPRGE